MFESVGYHGSLLIRTSRILFTRSQTPAAQNSCSRASDERCSCSQGRAMLFAQPRQATKAAARAELCYIGLASPAPSLWPTSMHAYLQTAQACGRSKNLGKSQKLVRPWPEQPDRLRRPCKSAIFFSSWFCSTMITHKRFKYLPSFIHETNAHQSAQVHEHSACW